MPNLEKATWVDEAWSDFKDWIEAVAGNVL